MCLWGHRNQGEVDPRLQRPREGARDLVVPSATLQGQEGLHPRGAPHRVSAATSRLALPLLPTVGTPQEMPPARKLGCKMLSPSPSGAHLVWGPLGCQSPRSEKPQGKRGASRQQTSVSHKQERPVPPSGGIGAGQRGILLPPQKTTLPEYKRHFVRSRLQGGSVWEGTYHHQQPPTAIPVHLQVLPIAEAHGGHHSVLDAEVTWNGAGIGFRQK